MKCYFIKIKASKDVDKFKGFMKKKYKKCKVWSSLKGMFSDCVFVLSETDLVDLTTDTSQFVLKELTPAIYRQITDDLPLEEYQDTQEEKFVKKRKVIVSNPNLSFNGKIKKISGKHIHVSAVIRKKRINIVTPKQYVKYDKKRD